MPTFLISSQAIVSLALEANTPGDALRQWKAWRRSRDGVWRLKGGAKVFISPQTEPAILDPDGRPIGAVAGVAGR